jgi:hypothetical protein
VKCRVIRDDLEASEPDLTEEMKTQVCTRDVMRNGEIQPRTFWRHGAIIDHPQAYMLVRQGCAEPADDDCAKRAARSPKQQAEAQYAYERLAKGIHPEDFERYDAGYIAGYNPDGSYIPGPNWDQMPSVTDPDEEDDE